MIQARSKFGVSTNGLLFVNSFSLPFKPTLNLPMIGEIDLSKVIYGLCGGCALQPWIIIMPDSPYQVILGRKIYRPITFSICGTARSTASVFW